MEKRQKIFYIVIVSLIVILVFVAKFNKGANNIEVGRYNDFAICLKDKGAVFYGTWWCPHCKNTKELFGSSKDLLPYVECSSPDGNSQLEVCKDKEIDSYPTWEFLDGTRLKGEVSLQTLAEKTYCVLPQ